MRASRCATSAKASTSRTARFRGSRYDMTDVLQLPMRSLLIFIDETGTEDLSDPKNPTFGRGGCGVLFSEYKLRIAKPWRHLKRERLGGAAKPFHAAEFERTRPTMYQITGINAF